MKKKIIFLIYFFVFFKIHLKQSWKCIFSRSHMFSLQPSESPLYAAFINFPRFQYQSLHEREKRAIKPVLLKLRQTPKSIHPSVVQWTNEFPKARFRSDSYSILVSQLQAATARTNDFSINISFPLPRHPRQPKPQTHHPFREIISSANHDDDDGIKLYSKFSHFLLSKQRQSDELWGWKLRNIKRCSNAPLFDNRLRGWMRLGWEN